MIAPPAQLLQPIGLPLRRTFRQRQPTRGGKDRPEINRENPHGRVILRRQRLNPRRPKMRPRRIERDIVVDVHGFPPTLFITSTRDLLLSGTTILQRHFYEAGVESPMVVFEGLSHAFWNDVSLPESREAFKIMAEFLDAHVGR